MTETIETCPASISDFPDDLLVRIFTLSMGCYRPRSQYRKYGPFPRVNVRAAVPLLLVCKRWNAVVSDHTSLWASIDIRDIHAVRVLLERSGSSPLSVDWDMVEDPELLSLTPRGKWAFADVLGHSSRIACLNLTAQGDTFRQASQAIGTDAPVLQILKVQLSPFDHVQTISLRHGARLRFLQLRNVIFPDLTACAFPELRMLDINIPLYSIQPRLDHVLVFLSRTPLLQTLCIESHTPTAPPYRPDLCRTVALPHLVEVELSDEAGLERSAIARLSCHLTFSPRCAFAFDTRGTPGRGSFSLFSIPSQKIKPSKVLLCGMDIQIWCDETSGSGFSTLRWSLTGTPDDDSGFSWIATALDLQAKIWDASHVEQLECHHVVMFADAWHVLLSRCTRLKKIDLDINAALQFVCLMDGNKELRMPTTLKAMEFHERLAADRDELPNSLWAALMNILFGVLVQRRSEGFNLDELTIRRTTVRSASHSSPDEAFLWGWEKEEEAFADLRGVVNNLIVSESVEVEGDDHLGEAYFDLGD